MGKGCGGDLRHRRLSGKTCRSADRQSSDSSKRRAPPPTSRRRSSTGEGVDVARATNATQPLMTGSGRPRRRARASIFYSIFDAVDRLISRAHKVKGRSGICERARARGDVSRGSFSTTTRNPRGTPIRRADARPRARNPLCGEEVKNLRALGEDGATSDCRRSGSKGAGARLSQAGDLHADRA